MFPRRIHILISAILIGASSSVFGQLIVAEGYSPNVLVNNILVGDGVSTRNVNYTGYDRSLALFENGYKAGLEIDKGLILSSGVAVGAKGPNNDVGYTSGLGGPGTSILEKIAGTKTLDAAVLEFEFKPQTPDVEFKYVFASDEYKEWVDAGFNDIFGFFISGPGIVGEQNVALLPGTNIEVSIDNVNHKRNSAYYVDNVDVNSTIHKYLQPDGLTRSLTASLKLQACEWYTIKLAIADVGDPIKDSWVFIESKSFKHKTGLGNDTSMCDENSVRTLDAGHPDKKVLWSTGDTTQKIQVTGFGTYSVEVFTQCGSFKDEIVIYPAIQPISIGPDTVACDNEIDLTLEVKNRVFDSYEWSTGDTTPTLTVSSPGWYWLTVKRDGCPETDSMYVDSKPTPVFDLGPDQFVCGDVDLVLNPGTSADAFQWSDGSSDSYLSVKDSGTFWVMLTRDGCSFADTVSIARRNTFTIDIGPESQTFCSQRELLLDTKIRDSVNYAFKWSTGDTSPWVRVKGSGSFSVVVTDLRCPYTATDQMNIFMLNEAQNFYVPNAFTPNGDGLNETISPSLGFGDIQGYHFVIYTRWGQKVFETDDLNASWDGKLNGKLMDSGVYLWLCQIETPCLPDPLQYKHGSLTLMR
ncbi:MAG: choice-of-anchor L domain-containing protein [Flavobacteriales bacterium]|nr:choice-of-anchor L domain-containing protein [Bacteroidota bacterium]MCB9240803.1 choice-of-anchor L domain-containing protein [Flavobacteriales bacterium]